MNRSLASWSILFLVILLSCRLGTAQAPAVPAAPSLNYELVPNFFQLPPDEHFVEPAGVAVNSKGTSMSFIAASTR